MNESIDEIISDEKLIDIIEREIPSGATERAVFDCEMDTYAFAFRLKGNYNFVFAYKREGEWKLDKRKDFDEYGRMVAEIVDISKAHAFFNILEKEKERIDTLKMLAEGRYEMDSESEEVDIDAE